MYKERLEKVRDFNTVDAFFFYFFFYLDSLLLNMWMETLCLIPNLSH